jgi:hypothetical protein
MWTALSSRWIIMVLKPTRLEPITPLYDGDPEEIEDPVLRQQVLDGVDPATQYFNGAIPSQP